MSDVYEWRRFAVGDRVRVRLSAECRVEWTIKPANPSAGPTFDTERHPEVLDGAVGKIQAVIPEDGDGHRFHIVFDSWVRWKNGALISSAFHAAAELEPTEAAS